MGKHCWSWYKLGLSSSDCGSSVLSRLLLSAHRIALLRRRCDSQAGGSGCRSPPSRRPRPPFPQECWCCCVRTLWDEGRESLPQLGLCALRTDAALLTNNLSNLPLFFNPPCDQCYVDLCIDCRALFIAAMFLEGSKWGFFYLYLIFILFF